VAHLIVLLLATFAFAAPASADGKTKAKPPTLVIGSPRKNTLDRVKLELFPDTRRTRVLLTLAISKPATDRRSRRPDSVDLQLPDTARVAGLAITVGTRQRIAAKVNLASAAPTELWERFFDLKQEEVDTALLQFSYDRDGAAHYDVYFSPLVQGAPVTIEIEIELEPTRQLDVSSVRAVADYVVEIDTAVQKVKPLPERSKAQRIALPKPKPDDSATHPLIRDSTVLRRVSLLVGASTN